MSSDKYHKYRMELVPFRKLFMNEISLDGCYADEENLRHFKNYNVHVNLKNAPANVELSICYIKGKIDMLECR